MIIRLNMRKFTFKISIILFATFLFQYFYLQKAYSIENEISVRSDFIELVYSVNSANNEIDAIEMTEVFIKKYENGDFGYINNNEIMFLSNLLLHHSDYVRFNIGKFYSQLGSRSKIVLPQLMRAAELSACEHFSLGASAPIEQAVYNVTGESPFFTCRK